MHLFRPITTLFLCLLAFILVAHQGAGAEVREVIIAGRRYSPPTLTINPGDKVKWVWKVGGHDVVSGHDGVDNGLFNSGDAGTRGKIFTWRFSKNFLKNHPKKFGVYKYFCSYHWDKGMQGSIKVRP